MFLIRSFFNGDDNIVGKFKCLSDAVWCFYDCVHHKQDFYYNLKDMSLWYEDDDKKICLIVLYEEVISPGKVEIIVRDDGLKDFVKYGCF